VSAVWGLLTSRLAGPIASGVSLLLAILLLSTCTAKAANDKVLNHRITELTHEIDAPNTGWRARLTICQANEANLQAGIATQNASIAALKQQADAASARATAAVKAAQARSADARRDAAAIMAKRPSGDLCASALNLLREP
jgi:hypothetical protein